MIWGGSALSRYFPGSPKNNPAFVFNDLSLRELASLAIIPTMCSVMRPFRLFCVFLGLGLLGACGYAEWPPRSNTLHDVNAQPAQSPRQSAKTFIGASAVVVGKGDTVYALSRRHQVPVRTIIEANHLKAPFILQIGQRIELPRGRVHKIVRGNTLFGIANTYEVNAFELARINGLKPPYVIHVGETLILPSENRSSSTVAVSPNANSTTTSRSKSASAPAKPAKAPAWTAPQKVTPVSPAKTPTPTQRAALAPPPAKSAQGFLWPVRGKVISNFGAKAKGLHNDGINIQAGRGNPVIASENGVVAYAGNELRGFGNLLLIKHADGWVTAYAHNDKLLVKRGEKIKRGQQIATIGSTGNVTTPQLHFEIRRGNKAQDPRRHLRGKA